MVVDRDAQRREELRKQLRFNDGDLARVEPEKSVWVIGNNGVVGTPFEVKMSPSVKQLFEQCRLSALSHPEQCDAWEVFEVLAE